MGVTYFAYEAVSVAGSSTALTAATYLAATHASIRVETAAVRFTLDGTTPTASVGDALEVGDRLDLDSPDQIQKARFISRDGGTASLRCSYGKQ